MCYAEEVQTETEGTVLFNQDVFWESVREPEVGRIMQIIFRRAE